MFIQQLLEIDLPLLYKLSMYTTMPHSKYDCIKFHYYSDAQWETSSGAILLPSVTCVTYNVLEGGTQTLPHIKTTT